MELLPRQIIEEILAVPKLTIRDVLNFSATCYCFRELVSTSRYLWKQKYQTNWPQFIKLFDKDFNEWFTEARYIYELRHRTHAMLSNMSSKFYQKRVLSDCHLTEWAILVEESPRAYKYVAYDLISIIENCTPIETIEVVPVDTTGNRTLQYYAAKVLRFIRQLQLSKEWVEFIALPQLEQTLERGATFVAQWFQAGFDLGDVEEELDNLARQVKTHLKIVNPKHPLHKIPPEILQKWKKQNLQRNHWSITEANQIIQSLMTVFFEDVQFYGNNNLQHLPKNSFVNEVLKTRSGRPISLSIIYESVARRLGLKYDPFSFPNYFLLKFTEGNTMSPSNYYYIDIFAKGQIIPKGFCPYSGNHPAIPENHLVPISARQVVECFANDLKAYYQQYTHTDESTHLCSSLKLLHLITPLDISVVINLARIYMTQIVDTRSLEKYLLDHIHEFEDSEQINLIIQKLKNYYEFHKDDFSCSFTEITPKHRPSNLFYGVGMVMKHVRVNYTCVIYDWDPVCAARDDWQMERGVHKLRYKDQQPFYKVLAQGNLHRYVAQENLIPTVNPNVLHLNDDLGRHFSHFFENHYVPNAEKQKQFPKDTSVRHRYYYKIKYGENLN